MEKAKKKKKKKRISEKFERRVEEGNQARAVGLDFQVLR